MIQVTFPDGNSKSFEKGITPLDIAKNISRKLAEEVLAATVNGVVTDLKTPILEDASIVLHKWDDAEGKHAFWHSSSHLLAGAIEQLFPGTRFGIGPAIENGFYYDIDLGEGRSLSEADLPLIEKTMLEMARQKMEFSREEVSKEQALRYFTEKGDPYKVELIQDLNDVTISFYRQGNFTDLCRGPHLPNSEQIKAVKITAIAGAYWRGDEKRKQLTRVYGISFPKQKLLDEYLELLEQAKQRDHRKLGRELELFTFSSAV
ncbi:MAG: TGS domain-containing protein, partial [Bacteroidales bacterium]